MGDELANADKIKLYRSRFVKYLLTEHRNRRRSIGIKKEHRDKEGARTFAKGSPFTIWRLLFRILYIPYIPLGEREIFMLPENGTYPAWVYLCLLPHAPGVPMNNSRSGSACRRFLWIVQIYSFRRSLISSRSESRLAARLCYAISLPVCQISDPLSLACIIIMFEFVAILFVFYVLRTALFQLCRIWGKCLRGDRESHRFENCVIGM